MPRILIIDDDDLIRQMVRDVLERDGYVVEDASDGKQGLRAFMENPADLVITDLVMPEKEGIEIIIELRRDFPELKIIAISGGGFRSHYAVTSGAENALAAAKVFGASHTLFKPFEIQHLLDLVEELLKEI